MNRFDRTEWGLFSMRDATKKICPFIRGPCNQERRILLGCRSIAIEFNTREGVLIMQPVG